MSPNCALSCCVIDIFESLVPEQQIVWPHHETSKQLVLAAEGHSFVGLDAIAGEKETEGRIWYHIDKETFRVPLEARPQGIFLERPLPTESTSYQAWLLTRYKAARGGTVPNSNEAQLIWVRITPEIYQCIWLTLADIWAATARKFTSVLVNRRAFSTGSRYLSNSAPSASLRRPVGPSEFVLLGQLSLQSSAILRDLTSKLKVDFGSSKPPQYYSSVLFPNLPPKYEELYVKSLRRCRKALPIPCNPFTPFRYGDDGVGLESKPTPELMAALSQLVNDFHRELSEVESGFIDSLINIEWDRQIRIPFALRQTPESATRIIEAIDRRFPTGLTLPAFDGFELQQGPAPDGIKGSWFFKKDHLGFKDKDSYVKPQKSSLRS